MIQNQEKLKSRSELLKKAIGHVLRRGDVYTRYSAYQYLILLTGVSVESSQSIGNRIRRYFKTLCGKRAEVNFSVSIHQTGQEIRF